VSAKLAKQGRFRQYPPVSTHADFEASSPAPVAHMELFCRLENDGAWGCMTIKVLTMAMNSA
jgi:hypothetical protein